MRTSSRTPGSLAAPASHSRRARSQASAARPWSPATRQAFARRMSALPSTRCRQPGSPGTRRAASRASSASAAASSALSGAAASLAVTEQDAQRPILELRDLPDERQALLGRVGEEPRQESGRPPLGLEDLPKEQHSIEEAARELFCRPGALGHEGVPQPTHLVDHLLAVPRRRRARANRGDEGQGVVDRTPLVAHGDRELFALLALERSLGALELRDHADRQSGDLLQLLLTQLLGDTQSCEGEVKRLVRRRSRRWHGVR